jgi:hypothetical protein
VPSTSQDSSVEPSPKPRTPQEEEIQPSEFSYPLEEVMFGSPFVSSKPISHLFETEWPRLSFSIIHLASSFMMNLLRKRTLVPWTFLRWWLWSPRERIPQTRMKASLSDFLKNLAHVSSLQSPSHLVPRVLTRTTTTSRSSFAKCLEGWLWMISFIINIANPIVALQH